MIPQKWIKTFILSVLITMSVMAIINYIVNPYEIFENHLDTALPNKTEHISDYMSKFYIANRTHPKTIMMGTSRIGYFHSTHLTPYLEGPIYNFSLAGSSIDEQAAYIRYMVSHHNVKNIVWSLDFFSFNPTKPINPAFQYQRLESSIYLNDYTFALFSRKALNHSFTTLQNNFDKNIFVQEKEQPFTSERVQFNISSMLHRYATEPEFLKSEYFKEPNSIDSKISILRKTLQFCQDKNVSCTLYTSPVYYEHINMIYGIGLGATFEYWKKELASIQPFVDFCTINSISKEPMLFRDSSHAIGSVGKLVFDRIFLYEADVPNDFGTLVTPQNINKYLKDERLKLYEITPVTSNNK